MSPIAADGDTSPLKGFQRDEPDFGRPKNKPGIPPVITNDETFLNINNNKKRIILLNQMLKTFISHGALH